MIEGLIYGLQTALATQNLIWILIGCSAGTLIGMMPGLGPITAIALMIPVSYNLDPAGGLIMMAGVYYGAPRAVALAGIIALTTNFAVMGHGPWTLFQVLGWGLVGVSGAYFSDYILKEGQLMLNRLAALAIISGFVFNWIVSLSILLKTDVSMLAPYLINGLLFDLYHAAGNLIFVAWLATPLSEIMTKHLDTSSPKAVSEPVSSTL